MRERKCWMCMRTLPSRRWWQLTWLVLEPPNLCPMTDRDECFRLHMELLGGLPDA